MSGQRRPRPSQGRTRRHLRASAGLGLALAILTLGLAAPTTAQAAVGCTPTGVAQDLDRDGRPDVVASGTNHDLEIAYANGKRAVIRRADFPNPRRSRSSPPPSPWTTSTSTAASTSP
ncbi:MAG: hypothetical protein HZY73_13925 [Micropruina sp.]|nr:MAG: hypothetical protein HZY73_13925 [Micropruina sp.]